MGVLPSLGLGYVASALAHAGHNVRILDLMAMGWGYNDAWRFIHIFKPDLIGLSALTPSVQTTIGFVQRLKMDFSRIPIMVGGRIRRYFPKNHCYILIMYLWVRQKKSPLNCVKSFMLKADFVLWVFPNVSCTILTLSIGLLII